MEKNKTKINPTKVKKDKKHSYGKRYKKNANAPVAQEGVMQHPPQIGLHGTDEETQLNVEE